MLLFACVGCAAQPMAFSTGTTFVMDTFVTVKLYGENAQACQEAMFAFLREKEQQVSLYVSESEIAELNRQAGKQPVILSEYTYSLVKRAKSYAAATDGLFDITIAPLTTLWDVTSENPRVPEPTAIEQTKALIDYRDLVLDDNAHTAFLTREGQAIDLGGLAKGNFCDDLRAIAAQYGVTSGYASIGGNLMVVGDENGKDFVFGLRDPLGDSESYFATIALPDQNMATTGTYERFFEQDGVIYHHVLDPFTGYPAESDLISASVISSDGMLGDFLSTALFLMGKEKAVAFLNQYPDQFAAVLVDNQQRVYISDSLKDSFSIYNAAYLLCE